jgi:Cyclic nucleotide-binding domain
MRIESSVTSISWIPFVAMKGATKAAFEMHVAHYDVPPPETLEDLEGLRRADRFRFANEHRAYIDVEGGEITGYGHLGRGHIGSTTLNLGLKEILFEAVALSDIRPEPEVGDGWVRFVQTTGGRTGMPAPRRVSKPPYVQFAAPIAWTTLALTIHVDGSSESELIGASPFPRHWVYDNNGQFAAKSGLIDFKSWFRDAFGNHTPWGDEDSPALVTEVESALERELSKAFIDGHDPKVKKVRPGKELVRQGDEGDTMFLLMDGVLEVDVDGEVLASVGPGAMLGERALIEGGKRTSTLRAATPCTVVMIPPDAIEPWAMNEISQGHRREEQRA